MAIGIRELAKAVGLSTYTVSRALSGHDDVAEQTRKRVIDKARELGYTPNAGGRMLRRGKSDCVAFVTSRSENGFLDPYFLPVLNGLEATLTAAGLNLIVTGAQEGPDELAIFQRLIDGRRVDAVAISRSRIDDPRITWLQERHVPFTVLGRTGSKPDYPFLDVDHYVGGMEATGWLLDHGHRHIAVINTPLPVHTSRQRTVGWLAAHAARGIAANPALMVYTDYTMKAGKAAMDALLRAHPLITAVICGNDDIAFGAAQSIAENGRRVGRDISLIGCDDLPVATLMSPPLTTFRTSQTEFGQKLGQQIVAMLAGDKPKSELLVPELVWRQSVCEIVPL